MYFRAAYVSTNQTQTQFSRYTKQECPPLLNPVCAVPRITTSVTSSKYAPCILFMPGCSQPWTQTTSGPVAVCPQILYLQMQQAAPTTPPLHGVIRPSGSMRAWVQDLSGKHAPHPTPGTHKDNRTSETTTMETSRRAAPPHTQAACPLQPAQSAASNLRCDLMRHACTAVLLF